MRCGIDHDALLLANKGKFATLGCPDCHMVLETNPALSREFIVTKVNYVRKEVDLTPLNTMSDEELAELHASLMNGSYVRGRQ